MKIRKVAGALLAIGFFGILASCEKTITGPLIADPVAKPVPFPAPGTYATNSMVVTLSNPSSAGKIYYTLNGTVPTTSSTEYVGAITLNTTSSTTIRSMAVVNGSNSVVATNRYVILNNSVNVSTGGGAINTLGLAMRADGTLFVSTPAYIYRITTPSGTPSASVYAGNGTAGTTDGNPTTKQVNNPYQMAFDASGNLWFVEYFGRVVRRISADGTSMVTVAGTPSTTNGFADGTGAAAAFGAMTGCAFLPNGDLLVSEIGGSGSGGPGERIRRVTTNGVVTTFAGNGNYADASGNALSTGFSLMGQLAIAPNGDVFVPDSGYSPLVVNYELGKVKKISGGVVTTVAGAGGASVNASGPALTISLGRLDGIALDSEGNMFLTDTYGSVIRKVDTSGNLTTFSGVHGSAANSTGTILGTTKYSNPSQILVASNGEIFVTSQDGSGTVRRLFYSPP